MHTPTSVRRIPILKYNVIAFSKSRACLYRRTQSREINLLFNTEHSGIVRLTELKKLDQKKKQRKEIGVDQRATLVDGVIRVEVLMDGSREPRHNNRSLSDKPI